MSLDHIPPRLRHHDRRCRASTVAARTEAGTALCFWCVLILERGRRAADTPSPLVNSSILKRKRSDATSDEEADDDDALSEISDHAPADDEGDAEEGDFRAPKPPAKAAAKRKPKAPTAPKKPRAPKGTGPKRTAAKPAGPPKPRKTSGRKGKQPAGAEGEFDAEKVAKDSKIASDNALFSAWLSLYSRVLSLTAVVKTPL